MATATSDELTRTAPDGPGRLTAITEVFDTSPDDIDTLTQAAIQEWTDSATRTGYLPVGPPTATITDQYLIPGHPAKAHIRVTGMCIPDPTWLVRITTGLPERQGLARDAPQHPDDRRQPPEARP